MSKHNFNQIHQAILQASNQLDYAMEYVVADGNLLQEKRPRTTEETETLYDCYLTSIDQLRSSIATLNTACLHAQEHCFNKAGYPTKDNYAKDDKSIQADDKLIGYADKNVITITEAQQFREQQKADRQGIADWDYSRMQKHLADILRHNVSLVDETKETLTPEHDKNENYKKFGTGIGIGKPMDRSKLSDKYIYESHKQFIDFKVEDCGSSKQQEINRIRASIMEYEGDPPDGAQVKSTRQTPQSAIRINYNDSIIVLKDLGNNEYDFIDITTGQIWQHPEYPDLWPIEEEIK